METTESNSGKGERPPTGTQACPFCFVTRLAESLLFTRGPLDSVRAEASNIPQDRDA